MHEVVLPGVVAVFALFFKLDVHHQRQRDAGDRGSLSTGELRCGITLVIRPIGV